MVMAMERSDLIIKRSMRIDLLTKYLLDLYLRDCS